jgi:chemotaxis protein MotA
MLFIVGLIVMFGSVIGGYLMHHGKLSVLWQPSEFIIIIGAAFGAFLINNTMDIVKDAGKSLSKLFKGKPYNKNFYLEFLSFQFLVFKTLKAKGLLSIEPHIEKPEESEIFKKFPKVLHDHHLMDFFCDSIRLLTMGVDNHYQLEDILDKQIEAHHHALEEAAGAINAMGESMPALGIVAAVLGVIVTMGSITEPPAILGALIGAALVGTFTGVLISYGLLGPIAGFLGKYANAESKAYECMKVGIICHMQGNAPIVTAEFVRKIIPPHEQPAFKEMEESFNKLEA